MVLPFAPEMFRHFCLHRRVEKHLMPGVQVLCEVRKMFQSKAPQIKEFNITFVHTTVFEESQSFGMAIAQTKQQQHETNCASSCPYHVDTREPPNMCALRLCGVASRSKRVALALCGNGG